MQDAAAAVAAGDGWIPHGQSFGWRPDVLWMQAAGDAILALGCLAAAVAVLHAWRAPARPAPAAAHARRVLPVFLVLCGATQLMAVWVLWRPDYQVEAWLKLITALALIMAAAAFVPRRTKLPRPASLASSEPSDTHAELARVTAAFDEFVYSASHDLREPLRGIDRYATFLDEDFGTALGDEGRARLGTLRQLAARMDRQIDALREIARLGRIDCARSPVDLQELAAEVVEGLSPFLQAHAAQVQVSDLPTMDCDRALTATLFERLITNAVLFSDAESRQVYISAAGTDEAGHARLSVRDQGIGIEPRHFDEIFGLFRRLHPRDAYGGGIGAGLTIAGRIVERHGGRIEVISEAGAGSTFRFTLGAPPAPDDAGHNSERM